MTELQALSLRVIPTADLATEAIELALAHRISGYDALYVTLAFRIGAPLITADEKLVRAIGNKYDVQSLAAFSVPPLPGV